MTPDPQVVPEGPKSEDRRVLEGVVRLGGSTADPNLATEWIDDQEVDEAVSDALCEITRGVDGHRVRITVELAETAANQSQPNQEDGGREWRSIDSAPKDGTVIVGLDGEWTKPMFVCWRDGFNTGWTRAGGTEALEPTVWVPLPDFPPSKDAPAAPARNEVEDQGFVEGRRVSFDATNGQFSVALDEVEFSDEFNKVPPGRVRLRIEGLGATPNGDRKESEVVAIEVDSPRGDDLSKCPSCNGSGDDRANDELPCRDCDGNGYIERFACDSCGKQVKSIRIHALATGHQEYKPLNGSGKVVGPATRAKADSEATTTITAGEAQPINEDVSEPPKEVK